MTIGGLSNNYILKPIATIADFVLQMIINIMFMVGIVAWDMILTKWGKGGTKHFNTYDKVGGVKAQQETVEDMVARARASGYRP